MEKFYTRLESFANWFTGRRYWKLYLAILCSLYCVLSNIPQYKVLTYGEGRGKSVWNRINHQIDRPFVADTSNDPESHEARLTFRLTPPLLGKLLPTKNILHRMTGLFILQNICGLLFFYLLASFAAANFTSRLFSLLLPWCFAVLYAGKTFFFDTIFFFDGLAYLFLLIAVCTRKPWLVAISLLLAFYTDERAIIGSGFVVLYHLIKEGNGKLFIPAIWGVAAAIVAYAVSRLLLQTQLGMVTPSGDISPMTPIRHTFFGFILLGVFTAFKSFWLIFLLGLFYLKGFWQRTIYILTLLAVVAGGMSVFDFSRSVSYGFIGLLAVLFYLYRQPHRVAKMNKLLLVLLFTSFMYPAYDVHRHEVFLNRSLPGKYFEGLYRKMPGDKSDAPAAPNADY